MRFKKEKDVAILAHNYQRGEVQDIADFVNDSRGLSQKAEKLSCALKVVQNIDAKKIIFVPDRNLAGYVSKFAEKEIIPYNGYCYVQASELQ